MVGRRTEGEGAKAIIVGLLLACMSIVVMGAGDVVADYQDGDYTYALDGDPAVATIIGYTGEGGAISIPSTLGGYPVQGIGENAFMGQSLTSVVIPSGVISIGSYAFSMCNDLASVNIPGTVRSIGSNAFEYCGLRSLTVPNGVTTIGDMAFMSCPSLTSITLADSVTSIGYSAFMDCGSLTSVKLPGALTIIAGELFRTCGSLTSITIPGTVTTIQYLAFENCGSMTTMTFNGDAPTVAPDWIDGHNEGLRIYYYDGATGFTTPTWEGVPTTPIIIVEKPGAPTSLRATPGDTQVQLRWSAPADDGGADIDYYVVYQNGSDVAHVTGTERTVTGLANGVAYDFAVAAHNSAGTGPVSSSVSATPRAPLTTIVTPSAPTDLNATPGNGQVDLSWSAPTSNGGAEIDYYVVYQNGTDVRHESGTSTVISGLQNGVSYSFTVAAHNSAGTGSQSGPVSVTPSSQIMVPGSPTALAGQPGNGQVQLRWSAPADDGGADIDYYVVYQNGSDVAHVTGTERTVTGLANGVAYDFAVAAHNSAGTGPVSEAVRVTPDASITVPGIPTGLNYTVSGDQVLLSWDAPDGIGGLNITGYRLYRGTTLATLVEIASVEGRTFLDTNVTNGQTYFYRVSAVNAVGEGELSSEIGVTVRSSTTGATSFLDTTEGQVAIAALLLTGAGAGAYALWRRKRT